MPLISVIIPLYNHESFITEALDSILNQTFQDFEIIIINDGSTDKSETIVQQISDKRIRYFSQENRGAHYTINRGIEFSQGMFISILNSDDSYFNTRFEKCLKELETNPSVDAVFTGIEYINQDGISQKTTLGAEENWDHIDTEFSYEEENNITLDLLAGNFLKTTSNLFCRKKCLQIVGPFRNLRYCHDYDFFLRMSQCCEISILREPLLRYRIHADNTLREGQAAVDMECALVITDFLTMHDLNSFIDSKDPATIGKLFYSINTHRADRIISTLLLFNSHLKNKESILDIMTGNPDHPFWSTGRSYLRNFHDGWQARDKILEDWKNLYFQYIESTNEIERLRYAKTCKADSVISICRNKIKSLLASGKKNT